MPDLTKKVSNIITCVNEECEGLNLDEQMMVLAYVEKICKHASEISVMDAIRAARREKSE